MELKDYTPSLDNYVAKYMDENGCSFEEACENLEIKQEDVFNQGRFE